MMRIVNDHDLQVELDFLRDNAVEMGKAKAEAVRTNLMRDHIKAIEMKRHNELTVSAQEREAKASDAYKQAILAEAQAAGDYEVLKSRREAAALRIETWRTECANYRAMNI